MTFLGRLGLRRVAGRDAPGSSRAGAPADPAPVEAADAPAGGASGTPLAAPSQAIAAPLDDVVDRAAIETLRSIGLEIGADLLSSTLTIFFEDAERHLLTIGRGVAESDFEATRRAAHSLKSSSAQVGANTVSALAASIEAGARDARLEGLGDACERLHVQYRLAERVLRAELAESEAASAVDGPSASAVDGPSAPAACAADAPSSPASTGTPHADPPSGFAPPPTPATAPTHGADAVRLPVAARPVPLAPTASDQVRAGLAGGFSIEHAAAQRIAEDQAQRVLFVDDDRGIQDLAQRWLTASGFTVHSAMDGPSALRAFDEVRPDLVVLDVVMPGMNGFDTCREMRRMPGGLTVPIVMATGMDDHDSVERAFIAGASDFVAKPLNWTALRHRLRYLLRNSLTTVALRQSEAQLALAQRIARIGSWEIDYQAGVVRLSEEVYRIFGVDSTQSGVSLQTMLASIHPQDRDAFREGFAGAVGRRAAVDQVHRVVQQGGRERIVHQRAETQYRQDGAPLRTLGTVQDVTERAEAERALRLTRYALDNVSEAAFLIDRHGTIRYVNGSACRVLGYSQEEMLALHVDQISKSSSGKDWAQRWADLRTRGALSYETQHRTKTGDEIPVEVHASFFEFDGEEYVLRFARDISDRKLQEGKVHFLAYYDVLTGLPNRKLFEDWLHTALARAKREHKTAALLFVDLDHFKRINDSLGHKVGDDLLKGAADRLLSSVRGGDTVGFIDDEPDYVVSRWGGDEFTVLLPEIGEAYDAGRVAQRILDAFAEPFVVDGREMSVSSSIGIAIYPLNGTDAVSLMRNADTAMYSAKSLGRSGFQFYSSSMNEAALRRLDMEAALRKALERGELLLHYQPQIDLTSGALISVEALVRWAHPQLGLVSPLEFIPLAEDTGLIVPIGLFVLETAIRQVREWESQGLGALRVAVNVSARQLQGTLLFEQVSRSLVRSGLDPARLELEITESLLMEDAPAAIDLLDRLKQLGLRLAIDDFGTGYSSLSYLRRFPVDALKVDRTFVRDVHSNLESAGVVSTIIALARSLGLEVVAEGVENVRQRDWLLGAGDIVGQGYLYSAPLPAQEFVAWALGYRARSASQFASLQPSMSSAPDVR